MGLMPLTWWLLVTTVPAIMSEEYPTSWSPTHTTAYLPAGPNFMAVFYEPLGCDDGQVFNISRVTKLSGKSCYRDSTEELIVSPSRHVEEVIRLCNGRPECPFMYQNSHDCPEGGIYNYQWIMVIHYSCVHMVQGFPDMGDDVQFVIPTPEYDQTSWERYYLTSPTTNSPTTDTAGQRDVTEQPTQTYQNTAGQSDVTEQPTQLYQISASPDGGPEWRVSVGVSVAICLLVLGAVPAILYVLRNKIKRNCCVSFQLRSVECLPELTFHDRNYQGAHGDVMMTDGGDDLIVQDNPEYAAISDVMMTDGGDDDLIVQDNAEYVTTSDVMTTNGGDDLIVQDNAEYMTL